MSTDVIESFLNVGTADRLRMVRDLNAAPLLKRYFGDAAFSEYERLASKLDTAHLSFTHPTNLIFVPGVMGSLLHSKTKGGVWWIDLRALGHLNDLRLAPEGIRDLNPANQVTPFNVDSSYEPFLTAALERDDFGHEVFPYDWRKPLRTSAGALRDLIVRTYESNGNEPVHLVAHSMGGLMVRTTLMEHGQELWPKIGRIAFVGTPHYGAPAIAGYLKNHLWGFETLALLGVYLSRETFRSLWGVLSLLPAPRGVYPGTRAGDPGPWSGEGDQAGYLHPTANFDLYQVSEWKFDLTIPEITQLMSALDDAADFHRQLYEFHLGLDQSLRDRMLVIAGVGYQTLFRLTRSSLLFLWEQTRKETSRIPRDPHREGDGRVPLASAKLEYVPIRYVKGVHGGLTNIPEVYSDVFRWLNEEKLRLPETPEDALSQHLSIGTGGSEASESPNLDGTVSAALMTDDPGLWDQTPPPQPRIEELKQALETGQLPEFIRVRIL